jgi:D-alanyl-lipoteichoic acid acyltransferase DltB (MBOAT superfamily)
MNYNSIALFLHIVGALGFFVALGLEWSGLRQISRAMTPEQVNPWMGIQKSVRKMGFASMLIMVITGSYMTMTDWGGTAWIYVTLGALILLIVLSVALTGPRMATIGRALATEKEPLSQTFLSLVNQPLLWISIQTRAAIALGIVFLKTTKPDLVWSLVTIGVAIVLGLASALNMPRREQSQEGPAD